LGKKYLMALSGFVLVGFVFVHMAGNLQMFAGAEAINTYAYQLKALPWFVLWGSRLFLLVAVVVHAWTAAKICAENRASRPTSNDVEVTKKSGWASLNMGLTGSILFAFIVFHILHFTTQTVFPEYKELTTHVPASDGTEVHDVYLMVLASFGVEWLSAVYVLCMFLLCRHLTHGVSSMFQSLGLRCESWRSKLDSLATLYGWVIFFGFISIPLAVILQKHGSVEVFDKVAFDQAVPAAVSSSNPESPTQ
jgi:succinate dehydrogenase / fumarate reductase cytochrome b subunit